MAIGPACKLIKRNAAFTASTLLLAALLSGLVLQNGFALAHGPPILVFILAPGILPASPFGSSFPALFYLIFFTGQIIYSAVWIVVARKLYRLAVAEAPGG